MHCNKFFSFPSNKLIYIFSDRSYIYIFLRCPSPHIVFLTLCKEKIINIDFFMYVMLKHAYFYVIKLKISILNIKYLNQTCKEYFNKFNLE